jgi:hypothetical protein
MIRALHWSEGGLRIRPAQSRAAVGVAVDAVSWASIRASTATDPAVRTMPGYAADCARCRRSAAGAAIADCTFGVSGRAGR